MKYFKSFFLLTWLLSILFVFLSCNNSSGPGKKEVDQSNELISFTFHGVDDSIVTVDDEQKTISILFPYLSDVDLKNLTISFTISENATSNLVSGNSYDFTSPQTLIITSESGLENVYVISAEIDSGPSQANELISLRVQGHDEAVVSIDGEQKTIRLLFPYLSDIDLDNLPVSFTISENAVSNLVSGNSYDFTSSQILIITSESGLENTYEISAEICSGTAVIVSDTQNDIIPLYNQQGFFININMVINKAHNVGVPAYYIMLSALIVRGDSSAWRLPNQLAVYDDAILISKANIFNAFDCSTILHKSLMERGIGKVIITGVSSMGCVIGTCRGAYNLKYDVTLIRDAHAEPIGYRPVTAVEQCNQTFIAENLGRIITAAELSF